MRLGVIARCEDRGLGVQSLEVCRHLDPDRVLTPFIPRDKRFTSHFDWYDQWDTTRVSWPSGRLDPDVVRPWLAGLDVVYTAESTYDDRLHQWAAGAGCGVVVHANPEFLSKADKQMPVTWWSATPWRLDHLPPRTRVVPMPAPQAPYRREPGERVRFLHVAGWPAVGDRNGTGIVADAAARLTADCEVVIRGQHRDVARYRRHTHKLRAEAGNVADRWDLYRDADVLVMPRRFGGLCLERGTPVLRPDGTRLPIEHLRPGDEVHDGTRGTAVTGLSERTVNEAIRIKIRGPILTSSIDHVHLVADTPEGPLLETKAADVEVGDWVQVVQPSPGGVRRVRVGPRPTLKGLRYWWPSVDLDRGWARLIGLYLAEGHSGLYPRRGRTRPQATIVWNFGPTARPLADEVVRSLAERGIHADLKLSKLSEATFGPSQCWRVRCRNTWLYEFFEALGLGHNAWDKRAPDVPVDLVPSLVGGWLDGDGNVDGGSVSGFSRSTRMISDMWRLMAKAGVLASITHEGQRLDVGDRWSAAYVASWTWRMRISKDYKRQSAPYSWRRNHMGWRVRVSSVERCAGPTPVVAIETSSGRYVANDVLTHNCLPAIEAMAAGLAVVMSDVSPNEVWPGPRVPAVEGQTVATRAGLVPLYETDPAALAACMDLLATDRELLAREAKEAIEWAQANSWPALKPLWLEELARACW